MQTKLEENGLKRRRLGELWWNKKSQSLSRKSQSIAVSCSGALREQLNSRLSNSLCLFSGLDVWTSHIRKVICPRVRTTTLSWLSISWISGSFIRTLRNILLTNPAENVALPGWWIWPLKSEGSHTVTSDVSARTWRLQLEGKERQTFSLIGALSLATNIDIRCSTGWFLAR